MDTSTIILVAVIVVIVLIVLGFFSTKNKRK